MMKMKKLIKIFIIPWFLLVGCVTVYQTYPGERLSDNKQAKLVIVSPLDILKVDDKRVWGTLHNPYLFKPGTHTITVTYHETVPGGEYYGMNNIQLKFKCFANETYYLNCAVKDNKQWAPYITDSSYNNITISAKKIKPSFWGN